jgi:signal peptidase I
MVAGVIALGVFFVLMLVLIIGLTFSVRVDGTSMLPTLRSGDRLEVNVWAKHDIKRFDLVEATEPAYDGNAGGVAIVKRVIGLPGDRIAIQGGTSPVVYLRPAGSRTTYRVDNPTWGPQIGSATSSCCSAKVTSVTGDGAMRWATVPVGSYFVMGDNWGGSTDSRVFGPIPASGIKAKLSLRIMPLGRFGGFGHGVRLVPVER